MMLIKSNEHLAIEWIWTRLADSSAKVISPFFLLSFICFWLKLFTFEIYSGNIRNTEYSKHRMTFCMGSARIWLLSNLKLECLWTNDVINKMNSTIAIYSLDWAFTLACCSVELCKKVLTTDAIFFCNCCRVHSEHADEKNTWRTLEVTFCRIAGFHLKENLFSFQ